MRGGTQAAGPDKDYEQVVPAGPLRGIPPIATSLEGLLFIVRASRLYRPPGAAQRAGGIAQAVTVQTEGLTRKQAHD